ncbi:unnamed protein product [Zymoseptoria tritici ST99CH_1A5]|uniref:Lysophospholipase n=1 Tax=Zymoseptoria tritici ST99CH_1A5 TaxID=1276529 RepID=A0A1Y6LI65_ZYMTR|nr:unnamed protein product [Zymoseptoria tritici ST99CH_3D1]SMY24114.1 unnamed protein product [Zymoseptoria tritici ST99CH_1A5]
MVVSHSFVLLLALVCATFAHSIGLSSREATEPFPYAPKPGLCPSTPLVRIAQGLSSSEQAWYNNKKPKADAALRSWLRQFGSFNVNSMPTIGSALAGGFLRASLLSAGIHQQLDGTEGSGPMAGLLQAITYETTLSGSTAFQGGLIQNNWPSISSLSNNIWQPKYQYGLNTLKDPDRPNSGAELASDVGSKSNAGYPATLIDMYGRLISYANLYGDHGGIRALISDGRRQSKFTNGEVPMPIFTSIGSSTADGGGTCGPGSNGTQYEITPFEFGSWDPAVKAFMDIKYLGTRMYAGRSVAFQCTTGFDNLGFMMGTSANVIVNSCKDAGGAFAGTPLAPIFQTIGEGITYPLNRQYFSAIPNPFFGMRSSPQVAQQQELALIDGGNSGQVIPIWPLLKRNNVDVLFVWDVYYDLNGVQSTGGQLYNTYQASKPANLNRMPTIPPPDEFQAKKLNTKPTIFGCNDPSKNTLIYVPVQQYLPQTSSTFNLTTTPEQTRDFITNGNRMATNNNNPNWPRCVACFIMKKKASSLPDFCNACFSQYCYN